MHEAHISDELHLHSMPTSRQTASGIAAPSRFKREDSEDGSEMGEIWNMQIASSSSGMQIADRERERDRARPKGDSQVA